MLGEHDLTTDSDCQDPGECSKVQRFDITINDVTQHEDWDVKKVVTHANDIALIRLPRLAETFFEVSKTKVLPICLGWESGIKVKLSTFRKYAFKNRFGILGSNRLCSSRRMGPHQ